MMEKLRNSLYFQIFRVPLTLKDPIILPILGICSSLSVTTSLGLSLIMGVAIALIMGGTQAALSYFRSHIPRHSQLVAELIMMATVITLVDQLLTLFSFQIGKQLSVFIGLLMSPSILNRKLPAYGLQNPPAPSFFEGLGRGTSYACVLLTVAFFRELLGLGSLFGFQVIPRFIYRAGYENIGIMLNPIGAFFIIGLLVWVHTLVFKTEGQRDDHPY